MSLSQVYQNFHEESERGINTQISKQLCASYVYFAIGNYFGQDDVALKGVRHYFLKLSEEEREHAQKLIKYQHKRGGTIALQDIEAPSKQFWMTVEEAFNDALNVEKDINQNLLNLHQLASSKNDASLSDFLEDEFLQEKVNRIKTISDYLTNIKRVGEGLGIFVFDNELSSQH